MKMADDFVSGNEFGIETTGVPGSAAKQTASGVISEEEMSQWARTEYETIFPGSSAFSFSRDNPEDIEFDEGVPGEFLNPSKVGSKYAEQQKIIDDYRSAVDRWRSGFEVSENAFSVSELQNFRIAGIKSILENDLITDERLKGVEAYISADLAQISRPNPRDSEYADYLERRGVLRQGLFTGRDDKEVKDRIEDVETYARSIASVSNQMMKESNIDKQYDYLSVRQEAVREHFNNPRFVVEVGLYRGNLINDELLVDLDRTDLNDREGLSRSAVMADIFAERAKTRAKTESSQVRKIQSFQELREIGRAVGHNHATMIEFARMSQDGRGRGDISITQDTLGIGIQAFDDKTYTRGVMEEWLKTVPKDKHRELEDNPVMQFRMARESFEREYDAFAKTGQVNMDSSLAASFAVMEKNAQTILKNYPSYNKNKTLENEKDLEALALFSNSYRERQLDKVQGRVEDEVVDRMKERGELSKEESRGSATFEAKNKKGQDYTVDLSKAGKDLHIEVANGNHLKLSNSAADAEAGKFVLIRMNGLVVPKEGTPTKNGKLDAGEESRAHLEEFVARYGAKDSSERMALKIKDDGLGGKCVDAILPSGENLSQRMIRDGYGLPTHDSEGLVRREGLAKNAEKYKRGLWQDGFPETDRDWRSESKMPHLRSSDKRERLADTVGMAMAVDPKSIGSKLSRPETKIFALPLKKWSTEPIVDIEIDKIARTNPGRLMEIYDGNMEILKDLRKRKDKLNSREKMAHDRLDMGRRAIGKSLVDHGHMDAQKVAKDGHPMMSKKGIKANLDVLRPIGRAGVAAMDKTVEIANESLKKAPGFMKGILDAAEATAR